MPIIKGYVEFCRSSKPKKQITNVWYWQVAAFKGQEECLRRTLDWLKQLTLLGDTALSIKHKLGKSWVYDSLPSVKSSPMNIST